ncbi:hypothetical protein KAX02_00545 [candidate division WOR-3 bacterium]|nr:hypothetical protein [candidate division WOR-3 bacterium]
MNTEEIINTGKEIINAREAKEIKLRNDLADAILNYCKDGEGTIYIDDVKFNLYTKNKWTKASFYFKVEE